MTSVPVQAAAVLLAGVVLPLWIAAGFVDYLCHRATAIERTSGPAESALHLLQFSLVGLPVTLGLFLAPNAGFFALAILCILLHHMVAYVDVVYANGTRQVRPFEQMVHSFLELLPIAALLLLAVTAWPQFGALFGLGAQPAQFQPRPRMLPTSFTGPVLAAALLFNLLPYGEELVRCLRHRRHQSISA